MVNDKRKKGLDLISQIKSENKRRKEIEKGIGVYIQSREGEEEFLV